MITLVTKNVANGFILRVENSEEEAEEFVCQNHENSFGNFREVVYLLMDRFIDNGNKRSDKRLYLIEAPGYDSEKWSKIDCPLCFRKPGQDELEE